MLGLSRAKIWSGSAMFFYSKNTPTINMPWTCKAPVLLYNDFMRQHPRALHDPGEMGGLMLKKIVLTRLLALLGTVLVWFTLLTPVFFSVMRLIRAHIFRFDYLAPAELFLFALAGGILLLLAALCAHSHQKLIAWALGLATVGLGGSMLVASLTGLASGATPPQGWYWMLTLGLLVLYDLMLVMLGIAGILLLRYVFQKHTP
jgi:hypothetical protein